MMDTKFFVSILAFVAVIVILLLRSRPHAVKLIALIATGMIGVTLAFSAGQSSNQNASMMMGLVTAAAFLCIVGQRVVKDAVTSMVMILVTLGFSLPLLDSTLLEPAASIARGCLLGTMVLLSWSFRRNNPIATGAAIAFGAGLIFLVLSLVVKGPWSIVFQVGTAATLLPIFPFHVAYIGALSSLPGTLPSFLALLLPCVGWFTIGSRISEIPPELALAIMAMVVTGAIVTAARASVQIHLSRILSAIGTILFSLIWWTFGISGRFSSETGPYLIAVTLATSGLLLCAHQLDARYGTQVLQKLPGLARTMPKFGLLLGVLIMAAMGFPVFAVFSGFMVMVISLAGCRPQELFVVSVIWLICSLLLVSVLQRLLGGQARLDLIYEDLTRSEVVSLLVIVSLLFVGGVYPKVAFFDMAATPPRESKIINSDRVIRDATCTLEEVVVCPNRI